MGAMNPIVTDLKADHKHRICLTKPIKAVAERFNVQDKELSFQATVNEQGQIVLEPKVSIPVREMWLWNNPSAMESLKRGLEQSARGEVFSMESVCGDLKIDEE